MADYALLKQNRITEGEAPALDASLKAANAKVKAISTMLYTDPQVVILHCEADTLTDEELAALRSSVDSPLPPP